MSGVYASGGQRITASQYIRNLRSAARTGARVGSALRRAYRNYTSRRGPPPTSTRSARYSLKRGTAGFRTRRVKRVKMAKSTRRKITSVVQGVLNSKTATGTYIKSATGNIISMNNNEQSIVGNLYNHVTAPAGSTLEAFSLNKILDAVSVMFNGKVAIYNPDVVLNNFASQSLKFHVQSASYNLRLINFTEMKWYITIYELTPRDATTAEPLTELVNALSVVDQVGGGAANIANIHVDPATIPSFKYQYTIKKHKKVLLPGASISHTVYLPAQEMHFRNFFENGALNNHQKFTKQFLIRTVPELTNAYDSTGTFSNAVGRFQRSGNIGDRYCIGMETVEKYVFNAPENVAAANDKDVMCWKTFPPVIPTNAEIFTNNTKSYTQFTNVSSGPA